MPLAGPRFRQSLPSHGPCNRSRNESGALQAQHVTGAHAAQAESIATVGDEDGTFRRHRSASFILPRSDRFALVQRCQDPGIEPVGYAFLPHTQCSTGCDRNSSTAIPSPPTSRRRVGRKALAIAAMPGGVPRARPLLTSIAVTAPPRGPQNLPRDCVRASRRPRMCRRRPRSQDGRPRPTRPTAPTTRGPRGPGPG